MTADALRKAFESWALSTPADERTNWEVFQAGARAALATPQPLAVPAQSPAEGDAIGAALRTALEMAQELLAMKREALGDDYRLTRNYWEAEREITAAIAAHEAQPQPKGTAAPALPAVAEARGFVAFGAGVYRVCQTVEPGLVVTFRRPGEEDRAVGERNAAPDLTPIPPEEIIVRLEFRNVAGLDSLEDHLREIRQQHWPESVPNLLVDAMAHANANSWAVTKEWARGWNDARLAIAKAHLVPSPAPAPEVPRPFTAVKSFSDSVLAMLDERIKTAEQNAHPFKDYFGDHPETIVAAKAQASELREVRTQVRILGDRALVDLMKFRPATSAPAVQDGLTDEQRIDWLCEEAVYTCGQWQVVFDSDKESFIDAVDELAARAHGISLVPVQGSQS